MGTFLIYLLKSAVWLVAFYFFYRLFLSRETLHRLNRITLLGGLFFSFLFPFFLPTTLRQATQLSQAPASGWEQDVILVQAQEISFPVTPYLFFILLIIYVAGVLFFTGKTVWAFGQIYRTLRGKQPIRLDDGIQVILLSGEMAPFSWMNYIILSQSDWEQNVREILLHEKGHIRMRHSRDLLLAQLTVILQWFNPAAWLLKQELQNVHEYEADEFVLQEGVHASGYQLLLIRKAVGEQRFISVTNSFNHSKLKKRITMMLKEKSTTRARVKYLFILPLLAFVVAAFARPEVETPLSELSEIVWRDVNWSQLIINHNDTIQPADTIYRINKENAPLIFVDGVELPETVDLSTLNPNDIEQIDILKEGPVTKVYGEKGKNGVILITTKNAKGTPSAFGISSPAAMEEKLKLDIPTAGSVGSVRVTGNSSQVGIQFEASSPIITMSEREEARRTRIDGRQVTAEELRELKKNNLAGEVKSIEVVTDPETGTGIVHITTKNEE